MAEFHWHHYSAEESLKKLNVSPAGLSSEEIPERMEKYGRNTLPSAKKLTLFRIILNQFLSPLIYVLLVAAVVSIVLKEYSDAGFIIIVLLINAIIGAFQEWKAEAKASALEQMIKLKVRVKRDGRSFVIDGEDLVPGDIVILESGNKIPADIRIIRENNLTAEEAILTGESLAIDKISEPLEEENIPVAERFNMLFAGTTISTGRGTGLVIATGKDTEIGKIASSLKELSIGKAPLVKRMEKFTKRISTIILIAVILLGVLGYYSGIPIKEIFFFAVAVAVSAIPEGLPIAMTVALSIGASRMAKRNVIIRKLTAVEGLGSCTFIATDKTGTLTVDQQTARAIVLPDKQIFSLTGEGYNGEGKIKDENDSEINFEATNDLRKIISSITICNEGELFKSNSDWSYSGDPIDVALLSIAYKGNSSPKELLQNIEKISEIPFESERQYAAVYYKENGQLKIAYKGAVEKLRPKINEEQYRELLEESVRYAQDGYRIIAVGGGDVDEVKPVDELPEMEFLGFIALIDPLRPQAKPAVEDCYRAGVQVAMITGDHPETALSIAKEIGIAKGPDELISGNELEEIIAGGEDNFREILKTKYVYSRVSPHQKQLIVKALRESGHFIAVTGDGVNDAPALKTANIGVAMGYGTDVAKDTASIILSDNNFASIAAGIEEGRFTYSNLRKIIYLLISTGAAELLSIGMALIAGLPLPFLPVQLLWLNLVTNGIQDVALAFEAGEKKVMTQKPRKPDESIFDPLMIKQTLVSASVISMLAFGLWYHLLNNLNYEESTARNLILLLMVLLQNFHALNARSETRSAFRIPLSNNYILIIGILAAQGIHILALHIPFMQELLSLDPVTGGEWIKLFFTATIILVAMEIFKLFHRKRGDNSN
ncbi:MAG: HAD-IC family P-type ATPase [Salegentibacter sp.]|uniref:ATPase, P-type (Transporting), HAD superfamily, subfamily IC n=1 Tax=Salegentibacter flavus TaxID=287099 RepID=A0A1I5C903_9FLAO|nr:MULTISPECIES: HAD-IC family P-type ATPase [Salegentibacter]MDR9457306.1 HAD-IC family P-type ATPase [Salegentibacter sp.]SFN83314.1 ATPase, P-type (transporting), HAD superfamily, subfamily IC [Salegentibacter flavus]